MAQEYTQDELERMVLGEPTDPNVTFFEKATLDVAASHEAKRRVYIKRIMFKRMAPGCTDWTVAYATKEHIQAHPREYQYFLENRQSEKKPGIELIPGLDILHYQELVDYGIHTLEALVESQVPEHLEPAQRKADALMKAIQEMEDGEEMPASDRRDDTTDIGQRSLLPRVRSEEKRTTRGDGSGGRNNGSERPEPVHRAAPPPAQEEGRKEEGRKENSFYHVRGVKTPQSFADFDLQIVSR
jgi:hypothetical protein